MSLLQCDQCKNILKDPIFIPCGYSICKRHIDELTSHTKPCGFCQNVHKDSFVVNQKVSRLLDIFNRTKANLNNLTDKSKVYERLKQKPVDFVNSRFDGLKREVEAERDKIVEFVRSQVDLEINKCVKEIENHRERCLNLIDVKQTDLYMDISEINEKLVKSKQLLVSNKVSEDVWEGIDSEANLMFEEVRRKLIALQESLLDRCVYRFEPEFDYNKQIDFGRVVVERVKDNGAQIETISSVCVSHDIQPEKSPNPMANQSQSEIEVRQTEKQIQVSQSEQISPNNQQAVKTPQQQIISNSRQQTQTRNNIQDIDINQSKAPKRLFSTSQQQKTPTTTNNESVATTGRKLAATTVEQNGVKFVSRKPSTYNKTPNIISKSGFDSTSLNKSQPISKARRFKRIFGHRNYVYCICFDRTGEYIFTGSDDKLVKMWRAKDGMLVYTLRGHTREICDLDINYENTILASGANDKKVMCWNVKTAELIYINTHIETVSTVKFSPYCEDNNRWLISTGNDGILSFLKYTSNQDSYDFDSPFDFKVSSKIVCSSFSTGGNFLAIGTSDKQIVMHYISKTQPILIAKFPGHNLEVTSINFSNKSLCFLSGSKDGTVKVWNIRGKKWTSTQLIELEPGKLPTCCNEAVWNCDDSLVITAQDTIMGAEHHCIKIWTPSGDLKHVLKFHKKIIYIIKPHPTDPKLLLSASQDGYVVLWDIFTGQRIFTDYNEIGNEGKHGGICDLKWSTNNGELFASTDSHGHLSIFGFGASTPEPYSSTPSQLFFHTDYDPLCKSKEHKTIVDKRTKIPPNFMPYGYLTDYTLNPMPLSDQRLVATHENLTEEEFKKLLVPNTNGADGQFVIDDKLAEIAYEDANLNHKNLIQPIGEALLKESETVRLECSAKEEEIFKAEFADLLMDSEKNENYSNKRRERAHSRGNGISLDDLDSSSSSSSLDSISKQSKRKRICEDNLTN